jgi:uncharacterized RDD family membrane protein YckC/type II secretory pathway pseudopilin PulG
MSRSAAVYTPPVDQPPPAAVEASPYGGFWARVAAHFVDALILGIGAFAIGIVWAIAVGMQPANEANTLLMVVVIVLGQVYHAGFVSSARMATPGKRLCGLYVTDLEGHRLGFGHALGRNLLALFSYLTLYIGFIMVAFDRRKQALHDKMAGTLVHRQPGSSSVAVVVVIVVVVFFFITILGIMLAVAIPAYQDYIVRAKILDVYQVAALAKPPIVEYAAKNGAWPTTWQQVESIGGENPLRAVPERSRQYVEDVRLGEGGTIVISLRVNRQQGQLRLTPGKAGDSVEWACTSSPEIRKYAPIACRG